MHVLLHSVALTVQQATTDPYLQWRLLDTHRQVWASLLGSLLLSPGSCCTQGSVCALQESISESCVNSGSSMVGLVLASSKRAYVTPKSASPRAPAPAAGHCWPRPLQEMLKHSSVSASVGSLGPGAHKVCLSPLSISVSMGFDSKHGFTPPNVLLRLLLCSWTWGIFSEQLLQHLSSCWDSSTLGRGVSLQEN